MKFALLADRIEAIPTIASWYFEQWGHLTEDSGANEVAVKMKHFLNRDKIPLMIVGEEAGKILGVVELKFHEMDIYPEREHWLGGVFVRPSSRGKGIASQIIEYTIDIAKSLGITTLHLQTEQLDGSLYSRLGWVASEQVTYLGLEVLVMQREIDEH